MWSFCSSKSRPKTKPNIAKANYKLDSSKASSSSLEFALQIDPKSESNAVTNTIITPVTTVTTVATAVATAASLTGGTLPHCDGAMLAVCHLAPLLMAKASIVAAHI